MVQNAFLVMVICAFSLFGGVLAWASWMEGRAAKRRIRTMQAAGENDGSTRAAHQTA